MPLGYWSLVLRGLTEDGASWSETRDAHCTKALSLCVIAGAGKTAAPTVSKENFTRFNSSAGSAVERRALSLSTMAVPASSPWLAPVSVHRMPTAPSHHATKSVPRMAVTRMLANIAPSREPSGAFDGGAVRSVTITMGRPERSALRFSFRNTRWNSLSDATDFGAIQEWVDLLMPTFHYPKVDCPSQKV